MKLVYVGFSYQHHGSHSGYDQIKKTGIYDVIIDFQKSYNFYININRPDRSWIIKIFKIVFFPFYWWPELYLILFSVFNHGKYVFHIIYGENIYKFLGWFKFRNKIVLTLHQPPSVLSKNKRFLNSLKNVDKIIVMSKEQKLFLEKTFPGKPVQFIPHGVDTDYFRANEHKETQMLQIGNWLRDFELASKVYHYMESIKKGILINIVARSKYHHFFSSNKNVSYKSDIEDSQLLELFQKSKVVFLPLKDFTANNSLTEAMSCECEVVIATDKENWKIEEGLNIHFIERDYKKIGDYLFYMLAQPAPLSNLNRKYLIENISWEIIGKKTKHFIEN